MNHRDLQDLHFRTRAVETLLPSASSLNEDNTSPRLAVSPISPSTVATQADDDRSQLSGNPAFPDAPRFMRPFGTYLPPRDKTHESAKKVKLIAHISFHSPAMNLMEKWPSNAPDIEIFPIGAIAHSFWNETEVLVRSRWADMLFLVADARTISNILQGNSEMDVLSIIRGWDVSKPILLVPEMSTDEWRNPMTKRQLQKLRSRMPWIAVLEPMIWDVPMDAGWMTDWETVTWDWTGRDALLERMVQTARSCLEVGTSGKQIHLLGQSFAKLPSPKMHARNTLPSEILTMVFEYIGDWELAETLGIYTNLPTPAEWIPHLPMPNRPLTLEYTILTGPLSLVKSTLSSNAPTSLSDLATKLIFKFSLTQLLTYLSVEQKDIFWTTFRLTLLPHRASVQFNKPEILEWWLNSPAIIKKEYGPEALDGASRAGFVPVLDWWLNSGLPLIYTERALESASSKGHIEVLEWWRKASELRPKRIKLKVGKSILTAAQSGRASVLKWWDESGIPYGHEDGVARLASAHGHVGTLQLWYDLKGSKVIFDNQVLVGATKNGHVDVLEWWKRSGLRVEYKSCDIEEAMEDSSVGGEREDAVRHWWEWNGLNLGAGTNEWMKVKCLQAD